MTRNDLLPAAEAILFAAGEPFEISRLADALALEPEEAAELVDELSARLDHRAGGICLLRLGGKVQLCARPEYSEAVRAALELRRNAPLSTAALEVLAVAAYHQPVTKSYIEQVRGVDCNHVVNSLCQKRLLEEKGRLDLPGRPLLYGTTDDFLRCFGFESLEDLPALPDDNA
ncbi:MAG: SMC-Scp complex subunit ScpB [Oscillospiraceae bacterium]|nr:SMC-Scp complex subunit ScpB [Oscillospiraceae bacterium]